MYYATHEPLRTRAHQDAAKTLEKFQIDVQCNTDDVFIVRCWDGKSGTYSFRAAEYGACLVVDGDMGEWMWKREYPMFGWASGKTAMSDGYFHEKLVACRPGFDWDFHEEGLQEWLDDQVRDTSEEDMEAVLKEIEEIKTDWSLIEPGDERGYLQAVWESNTRFARDPEGFPRLKRYSYHFHWMQYAISWLANQVVDNELRSKERGYVHKPKPAAA